MDVCAAVYVNRGERLRSGKNSLVRRFGLIRDLAAARGEAIDFVGIDLIVDQAHRSEIDTLISETQRLAHEVLPEASSADVYVVAIPAETADGDDPQNTPGSALSVLSERAV